MKPLIRNSIFFLTLLVSSPAWAETPPPALAECEFAFTTQESTRLHSQYKWFFNTSNPTKKAHLSPLLDRAGVEFLSNDLDEIQSDHLSVVVHKASQFDREDSRVIVEDTALFIEGANIGENIRWQVGSLSNYIGRKASWVSLVAYRDGDQVHVFRSVSKGRIVQKVEGKDGIEAYFQSETLDGVANVRSMPPSYSAVQRLLTGKLFKRVAVIDSWNGSWQNQLHE